MTGLDGEDGGRAGNKGGVRGGEDRGKVDDGANADRGNGVGELQEGLLGVNGEDVLAGLDGCGVKVGEDVLDGLHMDFFLRDHVAHDRDDILRGAPRVCEIAEPGQEEG